LPYWVRINVVQLVIFEFHRTSLFVTSAVIDHFKNIDYFRNQLDQFCEQAENEFSHNPYRRNKHNAMCNRESTWSVIKSGVDFATAKPMGVDSPPDTIFKILRPQDERFVFVLDVSGSMDMDNNKRIYRLKQSTQRWIQHEVRTGSLVGVTIFRLAQTKKLVCVLTIFQQKHF
jgi:hypothetical protein